MIRNKSNFLVHRLGPTYDAVTGAISATAESKVRRDALVPVGVLTSKISFTTQADLGRTLN